MTSISPPRALRSQILRFGLVGVVAFLVNGGAVEGIAPLIGPVWAQAIAFPLAASVAWWLNRRLTFGASHRPIHHEWLYYIFANSFGWSINNGAYFWMIWTFASARQHPSIAVAAGSVAGMAFNFTISRAVVFGKRQSGS